MPHWADEIARKKGVKIPKAAPNTPASLEWARAGNKADHAANAAKEDALFADLEALGVPPARRHWHFDPKRPKMNCDGDWPPYGVVLERQGHGHNRPLNYSKDRKRMARMQELGLYTIEADPILCKKPHVVGAMVMRALRLRGYVGPVTEAEKLTEAEQVA